MSAPRVWTLAEDQIIIEMRGRGEMWEAIGRRFGIHRTTVINHAKQNGLWTPEFRPGQAQPEKEPSRDWWPLRAGHPTS